jgi:hypothetical protein
MSPLASWFVLVLVISSMAIATLIWHIKDLEREIDELKNPF